MLGIYTMLYVQTSYTWPDLMPHQVFRKIQRSLPSMLKLNLRMVSPELFTIRDLVLAVPGQLFISSQDI